jgi:CDP-paratose 2-epimerase
VYNVGGGRHANCSMLEAIELCERIAGRGLEWRYDPVNRRGDHIWYVSDMRRFKAHFPTWELRYGIEDILTDIVDHAAERWRD